MKIIVFNEGQTREGQPAELPALLAAETGVVWVDMIGPSDDDVKAMSDLFHFHPLAIEDTCNFKQRPKIEEYPGYLFLIVNAATGVVEDAGSPDDTEDDRFDELDFDEIDIFAGSNYLVTVHADDVTVTQETWRRVQMLRAPVAITTNYLLYVILDAIVDNYFPVMDMLEEEIDRLENKILTSPDQKTLNQVFDLKTKLVEMWRIVWPHREVLSRLLHPHVLENDTHDTTHFYLRDVSDHLLWVADLITTYRDTLTTLIDLYMSAVSNRLNRVVNRLTVITLGFGFLAVITGFFGMNFEHTWPAFADPLGVPFVLLLIALVCAAIVVVLWRID